ncbi:acetylornithine deacetylase [Algimonas arctica]|uniref:Acetylornithine deacetylase n=1 Tax=Algimonas arctica TaxID=1479486 RepID=A0A8J3G0W7_9PROT|nr:M20/M25/M40 family metallo-hydrolase [Algimonas arctica]GHA81444.1 acetylornithine deacetylase [Algimonas arctica]
MSQALKYLRKLVAFDTRNGSGNEVACVEWLAEALKAHAPDRLIVETVGRSREKSDSAFVLASWGQPKTVLNVHIDTVPSGEGWSADPLTLVERDGRAYGLGTADIKGAAAAILAGLDEVTPRDVAILFSGDEEHGSEVMPAVIERGYLSGIERAVVCEPTSCRVGRAHRGILAFSATFRGPGGHSSLSDTIEAPLLKAARFAVALGDYKEDNIAFGVDPFKGLCVNIGELKSDGAYNVIPTTATAWVSMRPPPGDDVRAREGDLIAMALAAASDVHTDTIVAFAPFASLDIAAFMPVFGTEEIVDLPYWTEASMMSGAGLNAIVYGPGNLEQAHRSNEYVEIDQLHSAQARYAAVLAGGLS